MKQRLFALAAVVMALGLTACGGSGSSEGRTGDTMETYFFDFTVNSAYLTSDYAGRTPGEGNVLLVALLILIRCCGTGRFPHQTNVRK